ncbi:hypothetical protein ABOM_003119 [Aspergillus bombycis]|uniref:Uncharacterized protein n=1 Tax=Aspergillus bombycis TaxID=109264 RepID=A0A1F8AC00_9EURO|nr:hypothetical protein ABOM_003119 [Aspergillus bombycis]OGM48929.1 hypothetical protein ABOM_003119 [Aspergillus bombycis]
MESKREAYTKIMGDGDGTFLYSPQWFSKMALGSVGYFDKSGGWREITNLMEEGRPERNGFKPFDRDGLEYDKPEPFYWEKNSSEIEKGRSSRVTTEASGAMAAAPVDASVQVKLSNSKTGSAALVTGSEVQKHGISGHPKYRMIDWVTANTTELLEHRDFGRELKQKKELWAVAITWVTKECATNVTKGKKQEIDLSLDVGATGIGKVGGGIGLFEKLKSEGGQLFLPVEDSKGYVVAFGGVRYVFSGGIVRKKTLREYRHTISRPVPKAPSVSDENAPQIQTHTLNLGRWDQGQETEDDEVDAEGGFACEVVGMSESDTEADKEDAPQVDRHKALAMKLKQIKDIEDEAQRAAEYKQLLEDPEAQAILSKRG